MCLFQNDLRGVVCLADDQMLGADLCAQSAGGTFAVINDSQMVINVDGIFRANLHTNTAADTTLGAAADSDSAFCLRSAGNDHMLVVFHRYDQISGTGLGADQTAHTFFLVHFCHTVYDMNRIIFANLCAGAEAPSA